jgi:DUF3054 family protein
MASIDHPERTLAPASAGRKALLAVGDVIAFHVVSAIGLASHGELTGVAALPHLVQVAVPFAAGWLAVAPLAGAFKGEVASRPRGMLARTTLAWLIACPIGLLLWSLVRQRPVQPAFAVVTFLTNLLVLLGWRGMFAWLTMRRRSA